MKIDLTKLIYNNIYKVPVNGEVIIPDEYLKNTDIKRISPVKVNGFIYDNEEEFSIEITVTGNMVLECCRTLKEVNTPFNIDINEVIDENSDNSLEIIQNSLDIFPIIWQNILLEVPLRVLHPDSDEMPTRGDGWHLITEDDKNEVIDPRLAKLSEFIKE